MPQPYDFTIDLPMSSPSDSIMRGLNLANVAENIKANRLTAQMNKEKHDLAVRNAKDMQLALRNLSANPSPTAIAETIIKYPALSEELSRANTMLNDSQKQSKIDQASRIYAALSADKPEIALGLASEYEQAYSNAGKKQEAAGMKVLRELMENSPQSAKTSTGLYLSAAMGPENFVETFSSLNAERRERNLDESKLTKAQAEAKKAAISANYAESMAAIDLKKKGYDIFKIQEDVKIAKDNQKIATLNAEINRQNNELKRDELKLKREQMIRKRDEDTRNKIAELESARLNIDNMLNTGDRILQTPVNVIEAAAGPLDSVTWTVRPDTANFEELIENFDSQSFMAQIPVMRGLGALSNNEGAKLSASLQNINLRQSPEQLIKNVQEAQRLMLKARSNLAKKYGLPDSIPDRPDLKAPDLENDSDVPTVDTSGFKVLGVRG